MGGTAQPGSVGRAWTRGHTPLHATMHSLADGRLLQVALPTCLPWCFQGHTWQTCPDGDTPTAFPACGLLWMQRPAMAQAHPPTRKPMHLARIHSRAAAATATDTQHTRGHTHAPQSTLARARPRQPASGSATIHLSVDRGQRLDLGQGVGAGQAEARRRHQAGEEGGRRLHDLGRLEPEGPSPAPS